MTITPEQRAALEAAVSKVKESSWKLKTWGDPGVWEWASSVMEVLDSMAQALTATPPGYILVREETARAFVANHPFGDYAPTGLAGISISEWTRRRTAATATLAEELKTALLRQDVNDAALSRKEADPK